MTFTRKVVVYRTLQLRQQRNSRCFPSPLPSSVVHINYFTYYYWKLTYAFLNMTFSSKMGSNDKIIRNKDSSNYLPGYTLTTGGFSRSCRCGQRPAKVNEGSHDSLMYIVRPARMRSSFPLLEPGPPRFFWWYENSE